LVARNAGGLAGFSVDAAVEVPVVPWPRAAPDNTKQAAVSNRNFFSIDISCVDPVGINQTANGSKWPRSEILTVLVNCD
jgi:hypothetical protein